MTWPSPPLGSLATLIVPARDKPDQLDGLIPWLRIEDFDGKWIEGSRSGQGVTADTVARMHLRPFLPGTVVCTCSCNMGTTAITRRTLVTNQTFIGIVPRDATLSAEYLYYALQALKPRLNAQATGAIQQYLSRNDFSRLPVPLPDRLTQDRIVGYLDRETARLDALLRAKTALLEVGEERIARAFVDIVESLGVRFPDSIEGEWPELPRSWHVRRLSQVLADLTNGYVGPTRDILRDEGVRYVQSLHIKGGQIRFERGEYFVERAWHAERPRIHLRPGDVLIVQTGDIGQVAVVPSDFGEASCHALQIARVRPEVMSGNYLAAYLRCPFGNQSLISRATGALHPHLEASIKGIAVLVPPRAAQDEVVGSVREQTESWSRTADLLKRQVEVLAERRQALIASAVTGRLLFTGSG